MWMYNTKNDAVFIKIIFISQTADQKSQIIIHKS
jgi:hypothetical protein